MSKFNKKNGFYFIIVKTGDKSIALPKIFKTIANKYRNPIAIEVFNNLPQDLKSLTNNTKN